MNKICPECRYEKNQSAAKYCGNCGYHFEDQDVRLTAQPGQSLDYPGHTFSSDLLRMYDAMYQAAEEFEKHNLSWHIGGKHVKAYELKRESVHSSPVLRMMHWELIIQLHLLRFKKM